MILGVDRGEVSSDDEIQKAIRSKGTAGGMQEGGRETKIQRYKNNRLIRIWLKND